jgi:hypothetical protein
MVIFFSVFEKYRKYFSNTQKEQTALLTPLSALLVAKHPVL